MVICNTININRLIDRLLIGSFGQYLYIDVSFSWVLYQLQKDADLYQCIIWIIALFSTLMLTIFKAHLHIYLCVSSTWVVKHPMCIHVLAILTGIRCSIENNSRDERYGWHHFYGVVQFQELDGEPNPSLQEKVDTGRVPIIAIAAVHYHSFLVQLNLFCLWSNSSTS